MLPMASLSRSLAPHLLQLRPLAVPAMSLQTWFAQRSTSTAAGSPADPFVAKMQQKTEQELLELLQKGREGEGAAEQQQQDESEGKAVEQGARKDTGEIGGPKGPEPTRYGDWELKGRVSDF